MALGSINIQSVIEMYPPDQQAVLLSELSFLMATEGCSGQCPYCGLAVPPLSAVFSFEPLVSFLASEGIAQRRLCLNGGNDPLDFFDDGKDLTDLLRAVRAKSPDFRTVFFTAIPTGTSERFRRLIKYWTEDPSFLELYLTKTAKNAEDIRWCLEYLEKSGKAECNAYLHLLDRSSARAIASLANSGRNYHRWLALVLDGGFGCFDFLWISPRGIWATLMVAESDEVPTGNFNYQPDNLLGLRDGKTLFIPILMDRRCHDALLHGTFTPPIQFVSDAANSLFKDCWSEAAIFLRMSRISHAVRDMFSPFRNDIGRTIRLCRYVSKYGADYLIRHGMALRDEDAMFANAMSLCHMCYGRSESLDEFFEWWWREAVESKNWVRRNILRAIETFLNTYFEDIRKIEALGVGGNHQGRIYLSDLGKLYAIIELLYANIDRNSSEKTAQKIRKIALSQRSFAHLSNRLYELMKLKQ